MAWRAVIRTARQPIVIVPPLVFPLFLLAINASGLDAATQIPGFPTDSYLAFVLAFPFMQGAIFATNTTGTNIAQDIGGGFFNRLSLTPMRGSALIAGHLAGVVTQGVFQASCYLAVGLAVGAGLESGPLGAVVLLFLAALIALGFGAFGTFVALRTGSGEATQATFPVFFVFLFISSMNMPRNLIQADWFRIAATINPVSYLIEGVRSLIIEGWDAQALLLAFGVALSFAVVAISLSAWSLKLRLTRT
jgi:ABC-2 type transport system permease protein